MATSPEGAGRPERPETLPDAAETEFLIHGRVSPLASSWLNLRQFLVKAVARIRELRPRQLNLSWITDSLAVGGAFRPHDVRRLRAQGVTAVLDLRAEASDDPDVLARYGIQFLRLPTPDVHSPSQEDFDRGVAWVLEQQAAGHKVFVHCMHGAGRGPVVGAAVLIACGYRSTEALRLVRIRRWQAVPNARQLEGLRDFEQRLRAP